MVGIALVVLIVPLAAASAIGLWVAERFTSPPAKAAAGIAAGLVALGLFAAVIIGGFSLLAG